ncbi:hypothetical protein ACIG3E_39340 [Streptomyces sp. NPDC053474]|uniref:hypothetical protein n=1 Tax=Streptomyces sp. NPDC053474 TaxID=3365704 RepID=UPI0037D45047
MKHLSTDRPDGRAAPVRARQRIRPGPAARARHWAVTTVIVLLSLLCGGAAPAVVGAAPDAAAPSRLVAPQPPPVSMDTRERTLRDSEVPHPPPHFVRGRAHTTPAHARAAIPQARPDAADPADTHPARNPTGPRPGAPVPARSGAQLLVLHCVSRS